MARHRRPIGVVLALVAGWAMIRSAAPAPAPTRGVTVAAHAMASGDRLSYADLRVVRWPASVAPSGLVSLVQATGRILAGPVAAGEAITVPRLLGPGLLTGQRPGTVMITIRVADPATLLAIQPGDRVDVLAASSAGGPVTPWDTGTTQAASENQVSEDQAGAAASGVTLVASAALVLSRPGAGGAGDQTSGSGADDPLGANAPGTSAWGSGAWDSGTTAGASTGSGVLILGVSAQTAARLAGASATLPLNVVLLADP